MEQLERRLDRLEWRGRATERGRDAMKALVPDETRDHLKAAGREQLLAVRSLLDHWIGRLGDEPTTRREDIKID
jgi:hypothetical protein